MNISTRYESSIARLRIPVGSSYVTMREYQVLSLYASGNRQCDIAKKLRMSPKTVNTHVRNSRDRLNARTIPEIVAMLPKDLKSTEQRAPEIQ